LVGCRCFAEERDRGGGWGSDEVVDGVDALLVGGDEHAHDRTFVFRRRVVSCFRRNLAVHDRWSDGGLASPVGGVDAVGGEVGEQRVEFYAEVFDEFAVLVVWVGLLGE
jgi:hypothetical protein